MRQFAVLLCLLIVLACGGGGAGVAGGGGTEMSVATRSAVITKVENKVQELFGIAITPAERCTRVAAYMQAQPEFKRTGVTTEETAWGQFTDGRILVVVNNRTPDWFAGRPSEPYVPIRRDFAPDKISKSTRARLFHSFGPNFNQQQDIITKMGGWLTTAGFTLTPSVEGDARLSTLRGVSGDGFFFFNTHGGSFNLSTTDKVFSLASSTLRTNANEGQAEIKADLDSFKVVYMTAPNGETDPDDGSPAVDTRYAITNSFVDAYWSFGENAVVFINACWSGYTAETGGAGPFMQSCKNKGAGVYIGWTAKAKSPTSENAPLYFVDRLTAANFENKESPDQRPFMVSEILTDMHSKGIVPNQGADLIASYKGTNVGLRPTIQYVQMYEAENKLYLVGKFGDQPGEVTVAGKPVTVASGDWTNETIKCTIPKIGDGSFGDVIVKVHGKESNKRQLTKWTSTFNYLETGEGTLKLTITASIKIRQDLARTRSKPGDTLKWPIAIPYSAAPDSTCSFSASGENRQGTVLIEKWAGGGAQTLSYTPVVTPGARWNADGAFDSATGEFNLVIMCGGPKVISGQVGSDTVFAGGAPFINPISIPGWFIPGHNEPGDPGWTFSNWTPVSPPRADTQYRPSR